MSSYAAQVRARTLNFPRKAFYERIGLGAAFTQISAFIDRHIDEPDNACRMGLLHTMVTAMGTHLTFDGTSAFVGRGVAIEYPALYDKLLRARRGGYCFEMNTLFHAALLDAGFRNVERRVARVVVSGDVPAGRTHLLHVVDGRWLVDVGFGGSMPHGLVDMRAPDVAQATCIGVFRVVSKELEPGWRHFALQLRQTSPPPPTPFSDMDEDTSGDRAPGGGRFYWRTLYHFDSQPVRFRDLHALNLLSFTRGVFAMRPRASTANGHCAVSADGRTLRVVTEGYTVCEGAEVATTTLPQPQPTLEVALDDFSLRQGPPGVAYYSARRPANTCVTCATPEELYDTVRRVTRQDFVQTEERLKPYEVTREEFVRAARTLMPAYGGKLQRNGLALVQSCL